MIKYLRSDDSIFYIVGKKGENGFLNGDASAALFNGPKASVYTSNVLAPETYKAVFVKDNNSCKLSTSENLEEDCTAEDLSIDSITSNNLDMSVIKSRLKIIRVKQPDFEIPSSIKEVFD